MHSSQSNVTTKVHGKMAHLEDNKSLSWQGQVPVKDDRLEGRLGTRGRWGGSESSAGAHSSRGSSEPPTAGRLGQCGAGAVPGRDSRGGRSGFLAQPGDALIKPRVHFPAQLSTACCASQE